MNEDQMDRFPTDEDEEGKTEMFLSSRLLGKRRGERLI